MGYDVPSMLSTAASLICFGAACPFIGDAVSTPPSFLVSSITRQGGFLAEGGPRRPRVTSRTPGGFFPTREGEVLGVIAKGLPPGSIDASACAVDAGASRRPGVHRYLYLRLVMWRCSNSSERPRASEPHQ